MFVLVARVLLKHSKRNIDRAREDKNLKKVVAATLKTLISIVSVMFMFGLTWLFGALSISGAAIVFQWFFVIFATTQGFCLFIFFCVVGKDAREEWKKLLSCYRYKGSKQTTTPSGVSSGVKHRSSSTKDAPLTSKMINSYTMRRSAGLLGKVDFDSSVAMSDFSPTKTSFTNSPIHEQDTSLIISSGPEKLEQVIL